MLDWGKGNLINQKLFLITLSTKYMKQLEEKISSIRKPQEIKKKNIVESQNMLQYFETNQEFQIT